MYVSFNCPKCNQDLEVEKSMVGEQIECPTCAELLTIPDGNQVPPPAPPPKEKHSHSVPVREGSAEMLLKKKTAAEPADAAPHPKQFRIRCIKRINCVEVGHDLFEDKVAKAIEKIGDENVVSLHPISYGYMDTVGHMLPDYGVMIVYKG